MDVSLLLWFERFVALERYRDFGLPASHENLNRWRRAYPKRPDLEATSTEVGQLLKSYVRYADGTASDSTARGRWKRS